MIHTTFTASRSIFWFESDQTEALAIEQWNSVAITVRQAGSPSIDVTKLSIDKAHGIEKLRVIFGIGLGEMLFAGDALFAGGNDHPVKQAVVMSIQVNNAEETKHVIEMFLASGAGVESASHREEVAR